jgi:hypothetical protein
VLALPDFVHLSRVFGGENVEALFGEISAQQVSQSGVVVNNKNFSYAMGI